MVYLKAGKIARIEWFRTRQLRESVDLFEDEFVVMPNHIHGIIWLSGDPVVGVEYHSLRSGTHKPQRRSTPTKSPLVIPGSIPEIVRAYKSAVTYAINAIQNTRGQPVW